MLSISLFLSCVLLLIVVAVVLCAHQPVLQTFAWCTAFVLLPVMVFLVLPALFWHSLSLIASVLVWQSLHLRKATFIPLALLVTCAVYGVIGWSKYQEVVRLQERNPRESLEARLPLPKPVSRPETLLPRTNANLKGLETWLDEEHPEYVPYYRDRSRHLQALHENTVDVFMNSPGFGMGRMTYVSQSAVEQGLRNDPPIPNPGDPPTLLSPGEWEQNIAPTEQASLGSMHSASLRDFIHPGGFGYVKDRSYVLGFQSHRFSQVPEVKNWKVHTVELVGLLFHDEPVAYVSKHLPRMDELRKAPTRKLDSFEVAGLTELRKGEDTFIAGQQRELRMLGAVRAVQQCAKCHGSERGDLLGAFSYTLRR